MCLHNLLSGHKTCLFGLLRLLPNASFFNFRTKLVYQLGCPDNFVSICFISHLTVSNLACNQSFFLDNPCNTLQGIICNLTFLSSKDLQKLYTSGFFNEISLLLNYVALLEKCVRIK